MLQKLKIKRVWKARRGAILSVTNVEFSNMGEWGKNV